MKHTHIIRPAILAAAIAMAMPQSAGAQGPYTIYRPDNAYSWESDLHHRLEVDFCKTKDEVVAEIRRYIPDVSEAQLAAWERSGALETRTIDGKKLYFHAAARNLFRIDPICHAIKVEKDGGETDENVATRSANVRAVMKECAQSADRMGEPKHFHMRYTITVEADAVPAGQTVRCWMPLPRTDVARQRDVKLLSTSEKKYVRAPQNYAHNTVYMEKKAVKGKPTVFQEEFEYTSYGQWMDLKETDFAPYDTASTLYKTYTSERNAHVVFTPRLRQLAAQLTLGARTPLEKLRRIFDYVDANFPWASAREYSTIENIPEYVLENHHGDCGQVTLLFVTLARIAGIPARFQSGFMMHPDEKGLHDWGEFYVEGKGWVPVDMSFGRPSYAQNEAETYFYLGGIDSYRMVVNNDFGAALYPAKRYPRSETVDFQRGEVEWDGGNLYFDKWDWSLDYAE